MDIEAFNEYAQKLRESGMPGAEVAIWLTAVACGYRLVPAAGSGSGELQAVRS